MIHFNGVKRTKRQRFHKIDLIELIQSNNFQIYSIFNVSGLLTIMCKLLTKSMIACLPPSKSVTRWFGLTWPIREQHSRPQLRLVSFRLRNQGSITSSFHSVGANCLNAHASGFVGSAHSFNALQ